MSEKLERLDKILAHQQNISRKDARTLIFKGRVFVNDVPTTSPEQKISPTLDQILLDGAPLSYSKNLYLMLNKPEGVISASSGKEEDITVIDLVPPEYQRKNLFPAGRLDKETVGFVLITDDGAFAHAILSPRHHVFKTYEALLENPITESDIHVFSSGMTIGEEILKPATLTPLPPENSGENRVQIVLHEGRYHQIRRMMYALNNQVLWLKRTQMGNLPLDPTLSPGEMRLLTSEELLKIQEKE